MKCNLLLPFSFASRLLQMIQFDKTVMHRKRSANLFCVFSQESRFSDITFSRSEFFHIFLILIYFFPTLVSKIKMPTVVAVVYPIFLKFAFKLINAAMTCI